MKHNILASSGLALASLGDSFLYVYLPASYVSLGISTFWVGVLLSVNRLSRLFLNGWIAFKINHHGIKIATIAAAIIAVITTVAYGFMASVFFWVVARVLWGFAFSTLRLSSLVYAVQHPKKGLSIGISKGIIATGPVIALMIGPLLLAATNRFYTFMIFGAAGLVAIFAAYKLPVLPSENIKRKDFFLSFPSAFNSLVLLNSIVEAMAIVLTFQVLFSGSGNTSSLLVITGFFLGYRRICLVLFSPAAGWLADKWGFENLFNYTTMAMIAGIALISFGSGISGLIILFTFSAMNTSVAPGGALKNNRSLLKEFSDNATWRDIGTAAGTFIGALFLGNQNLYIVFSIFGIILIAGLLKHINSVNRQKQVQWK